jgi:arylsulfatase A
LGTLLFGAEGALDVAPPQLNVILIIADDLGVGDVGCYGAELIRTPNLDGLAEQGARALDAHATASVCTPSRYSILAGRYYHRYPRGWNGEALVEADRPTIASVFRDHGYTTAYFGKVHTGWGEPREDRKHRQDIDWNSELPRGVLEMGFDTYFGTPFSHNEPPFVFAEDRHVLGLDPADPIVIIPKTATKKGWGWGISTGGQAAHDARPEDQVDLIVTQKAVDFIDATAGAPSTLRQAQGLKTGSGLRKPFFINLALVAPHVPLSPAKQFLGRSQLAKSGGPDWHGGKYGDFVEQMDWCVGRVLEALVRNNLSDNTLVIFTSDNGAIYHPHPYEQGHRSNLDWLGQKTDAWEGGLRVPFIVRWPGQIPAGTTIEPLISLMDISKTAWAAAGITPPQGASEDALNQLDVMTGKTSTAIRSELHMIGITGQALRSGDWVYMPQSGSLGVTTNPAHSWAMQFEELGLVNSDFDEQGRLKADAPKAQLYNLRTDPRQAENVVLKYPEKAQALAARLKEISQR